MKVEVDDDHLLAGFALALLFLFLFLVVGPCVDRADERTHELRKAAQEREAADGD